MTLTRIFDGWRCMKKIFDLFGIGSAAWSNACRSLGRCVPYREDSRRLHRDERRHACLNRRIMSENRFVSHFFSISKRVSPNLLIRRRDDGPLICEHARRTNTKPKRGQATPPGCQNYFSDTFGHSFCVYLRNYCKSLDRPKSRLFAYCKRSIYVLAQSQTACISGSNPVRVATL